MSEVFFQYLFAAFKIVVVNSETPLFELNYTTARTRGKYNKRKNDVIFHAVLYFAITFATSVTPTRKRAQTNVKDGNTIHYT